ncbi:hypothetical protein ACROYT_G038508 [Oculina patagonica]
MASYPELSLVLSRNTARYLLTRNAGEKKLLKRTSFLIEEARCEEKKTLEIERKKLLRRHSSLSAIQTPPPHTEREQLLQTFTPSPTVKFNAAKKILWRSEADKWEVQSDTPLFKRQRRKQGTLASNNKPLCSSYASFNHSGTLRHAAVMREQARTKRSTSLGCILPPISLPRTTYSQENGARKWKSDRKEETSRKTFKKLNF